MYIGHSREYRAKHMEDHTAGHIYLVIYICSYPLLILDNSNCSLNTVQGLLPSAVHQSINPCKNEEEQNCSSLPSDMCRIYMTLLF